MYISTHKGIIKMFLKLKKMAVVISEIVARSQSNRWNSCRYGRRMALQLAHYTGKVLTFRSEAGPVGTRFPSHLRVTTASPLHLGSFQQFKALPGCCWIKRLPPSPKMQI